MKLRHAVLVAAILVLAAPALAQATLVYQKGVNKTAVYAAQDDGSGAKRLATGALPHVSPDGQTVAYVAIINGDKPELREIPAAGGLPRVLLSPWRYGIFA